MGGVVLDRNYPFEINEIHPIYQSKEDLRNQIERMISELLAILNDGT